MNLQLGRSTLGFAVLTAMGLLIPKSGKTDVVASSSTEVELIAMIFGMKMATWFRNFFAEIGVKFDLPSVVKEDNRAAQFIMDDVSISDKTKHIAMKIWFARQKLNKGQFDIEHCPGIIMWADCLTKALNEAAFKEGFFQLTGQKL